MSKITEVAKGLKATTYAVHHDEYNKGFITGTLSTVGGVLVGLVLADVIAIVGTYIIDKQ
jgi:hypothetical protein